MFTLILNLFFMDIKYDCGPLHTNIILVRFKASRLVAPLTSYSLRARLA
jgi:hypothetical protein